jgi:3D (Asp-Asp-Asp) domain-containing protein
MRQSCSNQAECKAGRHRFAREISVALLVNNLLITPHPPLKYIRFVILIVCAAAGAILLSSCGTTAVRALPAYEPPLVKSNFQTVRTTAYTHTESDHLQFTDHNALGGRLQAAGPPIHRAENTRLPLEIEGDYRVVSYKPAPQPFSMNDDDPRPTVRKATRATAITTTTTMRTVKVVRGKRVVVKTKPQPPKVGSAAADWSRWPMGTTFRLLSTGQIYRVDDYGWALAGRNTIDLYMATQADMNAWGAREEPIQILKWGDSEESLRLLERHQDYKHIRRMLLELQGNEEAAAQLH